MSEVTKLFNRLQEPFSWDDIEIKVQSVSKNKDKAMPVAYMDARCVRRRLNEVFGHAGWTAQYRELYEDQLLWLRTKDGKSQTQIAGKVLIGVVCKIVATLPDGTRVEREEVGLPTDIEPLKGAYSDSLKRAFAAFGNDHLYHINLGWWPITDNKFKPFAPATLTAIRGQYEKQIKERIATGAVQMAESFYDEEPPTNGNGTKAAKVAEKLGAPRNGNGEALELEPYTGPTVRE